MVKIHLSINNNEDVILLPVTPPEIEINESWNNAETEGMNQNMNLILNKRLSGLQLSSFFPVRPYPFAADDALTGMEYVKKIKKWWDKKLPLRLVITKDGKTLVNEAVTLDEFTYKIGSDGDIYYTLTLKQFIFVKV